MLPPISSRKLHPAASASQLAWYTRFAGSLAAAFLLTGPVELEARQNDKPGGPASRTARMIRVELPIGHQTVQQLRSAIGQVAAAAPAVVRPEERPLVILEFATSATQDGRGSQLSDCMELAQFLAGGELNRVQVVSWIPPRRGGTGVAPPPGQAVEAPALVGHAVLPAICTDLLVLDENMSLGRADMGLDRPDPLARDIYRNLAGQRLLIPAELTLSMIDPAIGLHSVRTADGELLAEDGQLRELEAAGKVIESETLSTPGSTSLYSAAQLKRLSANCRSVAGKEGLARLLGTDLSRVENDIAIEGPLRGLRQELHGYIDAQTVEWVIRAIDQRTRNDGQANLVILAIDSTGGDLDACFKLADFLAGFDPTRIRTAAWIEGQARGPAAVIALACDHLLMPREGRLGGPWKPGVDLANDPGLVDDAGQLAADLERDPGLVMAMLDPAADVNRYRNAQTGQVRWLTPGQQAALADATNWQLLGAAPSAEGLAAVDGEGDGIVRSFIETDPEIAVYYQLAEAPESLKPTRTDAFLLSFARTLASPMISVWLLFLGFMLVMTELSTPGVGLPGFLGTLCLVLYFWSHYLGGSAEWFEILLFLLGLGLILIELFVLPGFGLFGVAGIVMMVVAIVLAAQTFVIPRTSEELAQLPGSLLMVAGAGAGFIGAVLLFRHVLPETPYFKRLMLKPPTSDPVAEAVVGSAQRELSPRD
jgi:membrane-bound serine protease (ClpP class)